MYTGQYVFAQVMGYLPWPVFAGAWRDTAGITRSKAFPASISSAASPLRN